MTRLANACAQGDKHWPRAFAASAALHIGLVVVASVVIVRSHPASPSWDVLEANAIEAEATELPLVAFRASPSETPRRAAPDDRANGNAPLPSASVLPGPSSASRSRLDVARLRSAIPLSSTELTEVRTAGGLAERVGPTVYNDAGANAGGGANGSAAGSAAGSGVGGGQGDGFFGIQTTGRRVVYLVDASSSMNRPYDGEGKTRFGQSKIELARSILSLREDQQFYVIFFNEHPNPMPAAGMEPAVPQNQRKFVNWIASVGAAGLTDPRAGLELAMGLNPDVVFLLTDGTFPRGVQGELARMRLAKTQINTIAFGDASAEPFLRKLAANHGGRYAFVP